MLLPQAAITQKEDSCHKTSFDFVATCLWMLHAGGGMRLCLGYHSL
jgi:hypothetical protein